MTTMDLNGRPYAKDPKPGDRVEVDGDFTCLEAGAIRTVRKDSRGCLWIKCNEGQHFLDGQRDDKIKCLIGVYPARKDN